MAFDSTLESRTTSIIDTLVDCLPNAKADLSPSVPDGSCYQGRQVVRLQGDLQAADGVSGYTSCGGNG